MVLVFTRLKFKRYRCLRSNTQCRLFESSRHWNCKSLISRNFIRCRGNVVWLMAKNFLNGHDGTKSCADCLSKFCSLSLAVFHCHHRNINSTSSTCTDNMLYVIFSSWLFNIIYNRTAGQAIKQNRVSVPVISLSINELKHVYTVPTWSGATRVQGCHDPSKIGVSQCIRLWKIAPHI